MHTLKNFPKIPASVGGQSIPDFLKFKVRGPVKRRPVPDKFNFAITASPHFGTQEGSTFDEGKLWHPISSLEFTSSTGSDGGLMSFRGNYKARSTSLFGQEASSKNVVKLDNGEFVKGISGTADHYITSLTIHTSKRDVPVVNGNGGKEFQFVVPADHQVVAFHGTENGNRIASFGVLHQRRLETISDTSALAADDPAPVLTASLSSQWLDATTQSAWASNDMNTVENLKAKASQDLLPIYANIASNGDNAWTEVEGDDGEIYYLSWTENGVIWSYTPTASNGVKTEAANDNTKTTTAIVSIGSYSTTANFLGISMYNWSNIPITVFSGILGLGFAYLVRPIIQTGVEMGLQAAANLLAEGLAAAGAESAAVLIPSSVATAGGLVIAGILGVALALGCIALSSVIFKQYFLIINVYNFDTAHQWSTVQHYEDNSVVSSGGWQDQTLAKFVLQGNKVAPPGFNPVTTLNNVVTYLNANFQNDSTFLQGLGEGIVLNRDDEVAALAIKYVVHRTSDNEIGAEGINGTGTTFDLGDYYNNGTWNDSTSCQAIAGGMDISCYTPALGGASNDTYTFEVNIGLPPNPSS